MNEQRTIYQAIESRGYVGDWTRDELIGRHLLKLIEETGELADAINVPGSINYWPWHKLGKAAERSRLLFDYSSRRDWQGLTVNEELLAKELTDCAVVLFSFAELIGLDLVQAAVDKATADIERGVR